jgi:hypothetical protein
VVPELERLDVRLRAVERRLGNEEMCCTVRGQKDISAATVAGSISDNNSLWKQ